MTDSAFNIAETAAMVSATVVTLAFCGAFLILLVAAAYQR